MFLCLGGKLGGYLSALDPPNKHFNQVILISLMCTASLSQPADRLPALQQIRLRGSDLSLPPLAGPAPVGPSRIPSPGRRIAA